MTSNNQKPKDNSVNRPPLQQSSCPRYQFHPAADDLEVMAAGSPSTSGNGSTVPIRNRLITVYPTAPRAVNTNPDGNNLRDLVLEVARLGNYVKDLVPEVARLSNKMEFLTDLFKQTVDANNRTARSFVDQQQKMQQQVDRLENIIAQCNTTKTVEDNLLLPIRTAALFLKTDNYLRSNENLNKVLKIRLRSCKCDTLKDTVCRAMHMMLDRQCATELSFSGKRKQLSFRGSMFYSNLLDVALEDSTTNADDAKLLEKQVMLWFHGARDRLGGRKRPRLSKPPRLTQSSYVSDQSTDDEKENNC